MHIKFGFATLGLLLQELLPFPYIQFPGFFSAAFWDIELKFGVWIYFGLTRSSLSFVKLDLLLQDLLPFAKIYFSILFYAVFWDFDLKQIKSQCICFVGVMPLKYLLGPVGDMYCLSNTFRMLVVLVCFENPMNLFVFRFRESAGHWISVACLSVRPLQKNFIYFTITFETLEAGFSCFTCTDSGSNFVGVNKILSNNYERNSKMYIFTLNSCVNFNPSWGHFDLGYICLRSY